MVAFAEREVALPYPKETRYARDWNLPTVFLEYWKWAEQLGEQEAAKKVDPTIWTNIVTYHGEAAGKQYPIPLWTKIEPVVVRLGGRQKVRFLFQNPQYTAGEDIKRMHSDSTKNLVDTQIKRRYDRENVQIAEVFDFLVELEKLDEVDFSASAEDISKFLKEKRMFVSTSFAKMQNFTGVFPELSIKKLQVMTEDGTEKEVELTEEEVLVGRMVRIASPKTPVHNDSKSGFWWLNRIVFIPSIKQFAIVQEACFNAFDDEGVYQFLTYPETKSPTDLPSDSEEREQFLMAMMTVLPEKYIQDHAITIFEEIISKIGDGKFKKVEKIDPNIVEEDYDPQTQVELCLKLFAEERKWRNDPVMRAAIGKRIEQWQKSIQHSSVRAKALPIDEIFHDLTEMYQDRHKAQNPKAHEREFTRIIIRHYPDYVKKINLSGLHCAAGSVIGGHRFLDHVKMKPKLSPERISSLKFRETHDFANKQEMIAFCKEHGLDPKLFKENKNTWGSREACQACGLKVNFIGDTECKVCPLCNAKDDYGMMGKTLSDMSPKEYASPSYSSGRISADKIRGFVPKKSVGVNFLLQSIVSPDAAKQAARAA